jgi:hypothetical protein
MKTAYLEAGQLLDYWAATAVGYEPIHQPDSAEGSRVASRVRTDRHT